MKAAQLVVSALPSHPFLIVDYLTVSFQPASLGSRVDCQGSSNGRCESWQNPIIRKIEGAIHGSSSTIGGATFRIHVDYVGSNHDKVRFFYGTYSDVSDHLQGTNRDYDNKIFEGQSCRVINGDPGDSTRSENGQNGHGIVQCTTGEGVGANLVGYLVVGEDARSDVTNDTTYKVNAIHNSSIFNETKISYGAPVVAYFDGKGSGFTFRNSSNVAAEGASTFGNEQINIYGNNFGK